MRPLLLLLPLLAALFAAPAFAGTACTDDPALRPLPKALVAQVRQVFQLQHAPADWIERSTVIRCMDRRIWACNEGANLPCGRASTAAALPAGADWCRQNPDADFIPAYIASHESVWHWRCVNGAPATTGPPEAVDAQGYLASYWKPLS